MLTESRECKVSSKNKLTFDWNRNVNIYLIKFTAVRDKSEEKLDHSSLDV